MMVGINNPSFPPLLEFCLLSMTAKALALVLGSSTVPFKRGIVRRFSHEQSAGLQ